MKAFLCIVFIFFGVIRDAYGKKRLHQARQDVTGRIVNNYTRPLITSDESFLQPAEFFPASSKQTFSGSKLAVLPETSNLRAKRKKKRIAH